MWVCLARFAIIALLLGVAPAAAATLEEFNAAVEAFSSHHRVALGYLRTGNTDLAAVEIERMDQAWRAVVERFGGDPPAAITDHVLYTTTLTDVAVRIVGARIVLDFGRPDVVAQTLAEMRGMLARLRRESGITVLADCVLDANAALDALMAAKEARTGGATADADILADAARYGDALRRCDAIASPAQRDDPEFRRLVDGALTSLAHVPDAVARHDPALLDRVLDELRAFDRLLAFRFG
jgi:hypothetical protein